MGITFAMGLLIGGLSQEEAGANNTNPKTGEVDVNNYIEKICDGPNLVYTVTRGITVSPNDPQCD